jgi:hypothetical protein
MQAELPHVAFFAPISLTLCFLKQRLEGAGRAPKPLRKVMLLGLNTWLRPSGSFGSVPISSLQTSQSTTVEVDCHLRDPNL